MQRKLHKKGVLDSADFNRVDWDATGDAQAHFPDGFSVWISKHVTNCCGAGKTMLTWKMWDHSKCPGCDAEGEVARHVLVCPNQEMEMEFHEALDVLKKWMQDKETCPCVADCMTKSLAKRTPTDPFEELAGEPVRAAANDQDCIGWTNMLEGKMSKLWRARQEEHYQEIRAKKTSRAWAHGLVRQLLEMTHRLWIKRCNIRHSRAEGEGTPADERAKDDRIREQFVLGTDGLGEKDQWLLTEDSLEQVLNYAPKCKFLLLEDVREARASEERLRRSEIGRMQDNMRQWMNAPGDENT